MTLKLIIIPLLMLAITVVIWNLWLEKIFWRIFESGPTNLKNQFLLTLRKNKYGRWLYASRDRSDRR